MGININVKRTYKINGREYNSLEEMPADVREVFEKAKALQAGAQSPFGSSGHGRIKFNGIEYESIDAMPRDIRLMYEKVMKAVEVGGASSKFTFKAEASGTLTHPAGHPAPSASGEKPTRFEGSFPAGKLIFGVLLVALLLLAYYLFLRGGAG